MPPEAAWRGDKGDGRHICSSRQSRGETAGAGHADRAPAVPKGPPLRFPLPLRQVFCPHFTGWENEASQALFPQPRFHSSMNGTIMTSEQLPWFHPCPPPTSHLRPAPGHFPSFILSSPVLTFLLRASWESQPNTVVESTESGATLPGSNPISCSVQLGAFPSGKWVP